MLALCLFGLTYLTGRLNRQAATIDRFSGQLEGPSFQDMSSLSRELSTMKRRFHMVTAIARQAYPMKVVQPLKPGAQIDGLRRGPRGPA